MTVKLIAEPVIYTNNTGGGDDEVQAPTNGENFKDFHAGGPVAAAWYCPYDNIGDLTAIHRIRVDLQGNHVRLTVAGTASHRDARVRIRIYAGV